jgi:hypothetical protein
LLFSKTDTAQQTVKYLEEYVGLYSSEETESKMKIVLKDGKLFSSLRNVNEPLTPVYKDGFSFPGGDMFFERDKRDRIAKMFISISRARKVEFNRIALQ